jgi:hypothetical protein
MATEYSIYVQHKLLLGLTLDKKINRFDNPLPIKLLLTDIKPPFISKQLYVPQSQSIAVNMHWCSNIFYPEDVARILHEGIMPPQIFGHRRDVDVTPHCNLVKHEQQPKFWNGTWPCASIERVLSAASSRNARLQHGTRRFIPPQVW